MSYSLEISSLYLLFANSKYYAYVKPQDILVLGKAVLLHRQGRTWSYQGLAEALALSASEAHAGVKRLTASRLLTPQKEGLAATAIIPQFGACRDFLFHGLAYVFPAQPGPLSRGMPTAHSAPPLSGRITSQSAYVWPDADGAVRGESIEPLYPSVIDAAKKDPDLHAFLALLDAIRIAMPRERELAQEILAETYLAG